MLGEAFAISAITADDPQLLMLMKWRPYKKTLLLFFIRDLRFELSPLTTRNC
jgi:hypothetical protein